MDRALFDYLNNRWRHERERVTAVWDVMTKREQQLVREAAVMAGVRATMRTGGSTAERVPPDSEVVADVISACLSMPDLYPAMARLEQRAQRRKVADQPRKRQS